MSIVLQNQIAASQKSAEELESEIQRESNGAYRLDVQDLLALLVNLFHELNRHVERWQNNIAAGSPPAQAEPDASTNEFYSLYRRCESTFAKGERMMREIEQRGFNVEGKGAFLDAWRELRGIASLAPDHVAAAADQVKRGDVRMLDEVL